MSKTVQFQTIQFSMNTQFKCKYSSIVKKILFRAIQFSQAILIQLIQFSRSTDFVYTVKCQNSSVKHVSVNTVSMSKNISISSYSV